MIRRGHCPLYYYLIVKMIEEEKIRNIITDIVRQKDAFIVAIKVSSSNKINIEIDSVSGFSINDCIEVSKLIESKLDSLSERLLRIEKALDIKEAKAE